jgi:8-hydroxy-5-deazaflavin:NADPH oxidoreductase
MAAKKTIAIIASSNEKATAIVNKLPVENVSLLLLAKYANQFIELSTEMQSKYPGIELDIIDCMKDGCWEADIIILDIPRHEEKQVAELIKEVSTQKIVVSFSENKNAFENEELENLLKYSKVVKAFNTTGSQEISLYGKDDDVVLEVSDLLKNSKRSKVTI